MSTPKDYVPDDEEKMMVVPFYVVKNHLVLLIAFFDRGSRRGPPLSRLVKEVFCVGTAKDPDDARQCLSMLTF